MIGVAQANALESVVEPMVKAGGDRIVILANGGTIKTATGFPTSFTVDSTTTLVVEFYTYDNGERIDIGQSVNILCFTHWAKTTKTFQLKN